LVIADDHSFEPWTFSNTTIKDKVPIETVETLSPPAYLMKVSINFYRTFISPVGGNRCRMNPSCSAYALEAVSRYGFVRGYILTTDRLIHESEEMDLAPVVYIHGKQRFSDPVGDNVLW
jgi:putative membrane protein insertion efficiency factor